MVIDKPRTILFFSSPSHRHSFSRTKRRAVALLAAGAAGSAAAYCAYTWYTAAAAAAAARDDESAENQENMASGSGETPTILLPFPSSNYNDDAFDDEGPSTSASAAQRHPPPVLIDPTGGAAAAQMDAGAHLQHHFDSIQQIADVTTLPSLLPALGRALAAADDVDACLERLRLAKGGQIGLSPEDKRKIWEELAAASLARLVASMWALPLISLQVRVQINVLGRHLYLETALQDTAAAAAAAAAVAGNGLSSLSQHFRGGGGGGGIGTPGAAARPLSHLSAASQESFLSFSEHLTKSGHVALLAAARRAADAALTGVSLNQEINSEAMGHLISRALEHFAQETTTSSTTTGISSSSATFGGEWISFLLPSPSELREALRLHHPDDRALLPGTHSLLVDADAVGAMMNEVGCIIESERFRDVALKCAKVVCRVAVTGLSSKVEREGRGGAALPLARLVPPMVSEAKGVLLPRGECAAAVASLEEVGALCATVYSCGPPL